MPKLSQVFGHKDFKKMVDRRRRRLAGNFERGVVLAALFLQRESQKIVPVDTGYLRSSAFTRKRGTGFKTEAIVGYTANYAIYVHENLFAYHKRPTRAQFLTEPARTKRAQIVAIIRREMEKK